MEKYNCDYTGDYEIGTKVKAKSSDMDNYLEGIIVDIKIDDGTMYYIIDISNKIFWFTCEELKPGQIKY